MHAALAVLERELLMLSVLAALGSGPTALLGSRVDALGRVALAPVFGLCVGVCIYTSLLWLYPASTTAWSLPCMAALSVFVCWKVQARKRRLAADSSAPPADTTRNQAKHRPQRGRPWGRLGAVLVATVQLLIVGIAVAGPIDYTLHQMKSNGPVFYRIVDTLGYVAEADGAEHQTLPEAASTMATGQPPPSAVANLSRVYWERYANGFQEIDATPLEANLNYLVGLGAAETQAPFLVAFIMAGALAVLAAIRYLSANASWSAVFGAALFGGPFFLQLIFDGSQAALCGMALLAPIVVVGVECLRCPKLPNLLLMSVLLSGMVALYPLFVPEVGGAAALVLVAVGLRRLIRNDVRTQPAAGEEGALTIGAALRPSRRARRLSANSARIASKLILVVALAALFDLVAADRAVRYWNSVLHGGFLASGLPVYDLSAEVVPGWLLQTRPFYGLGITGHSAAAVIVFVVGLPIVLAAAILFAMWKVPAVRVALPLVGIFAALGVYEQVKNGCSYCEDRTLLSIAPLSILMIGLAVAVLFGTRTIWSRAIAGGIVILVLLSTGRALYQEQVLFRTTAYALPASTKTLLNKLPKGATVDLEAFNVGGMAPAEQFYTYQLASELTTGRVSLPADVADHDALAYVGTFPLPGPQFRPNYQYVLTRAAAVKTSRNLIARAGALALEKRSKGLSVTLDYGMVGSPLVRDDPSGQVSVDPNLKEPVQFVVAGGNSRTPAFVELRFRTPNSPVVATSTSTLKQAGGAGYLDVCVEATGKAPVRKADVRLTPGTNVQLTSMHVKSGSCGTQY